MAWNFVDVVKNAMTFGRRMRLSDKEFRLLIGLIEIGNNHFGRAATFEVSNAELMLITQTTRQATITECKNKLKQRGLIDFAEGKARGHVNKFTFLPLLTVKQKSVTGSVTGNVTGSVTGNVTGSVTVTPREANNGAALRPPTKEKEKEKEKIKEKVQKESDPFDAFADRPGLHTALLDFAEHRTKMKKPMTLKAKQLLVGKLSQLASDDETRIAILEQSIFNGWQGVFALKEPVAKPAWVPQNFDVELSDEDRQRIYSMEVPFP